MHHKARAAQLKSSIQPLGKRHTEGVDDSSNELLESTERDFKLRL